MVKLTFLEVHLEGSSLTANAPFTDREAPTGAPEPEAESAGPGGGGRRGVAVVVVLLFLLALAALARRRLAEDETIDLG
jgi:hypothetical protein